MINTLKLNTVELTQGTREALYQELLEGAIKVDTAFKIVEELDENVKQEQGEATARIQEGREQIEAIREDLESETDITKIKDSRKAVSSLEEDVAIYSELYAGISSKYKPDMFKAVKELNNAMKEYKGLYEALEQELYETVCVRELQSVKQLLKDADISNYMNMALSMLEAHYPDNIVTSQSTYKYDDEYLRLKVHAYSPMPNYFMEAMDKAQAEATGEYVSATMFGMQM